MLWFTILISVFCVSLNYANRQQQWEECNKRGWTLVEDIPNEVTMEYVMWIKKLKNNPWKDGNMTKKYEVELREIYGFRNEDGPLCIRKNFTAHSEICLKPLTKPLVQARTNWTFDTVLKEDISYVQNVDHVFSYNVTEGQGNETKILSVFDFILYPNTTFPDQKWTYRKIYFNFHPCNVLGGSKNFTIQTDIAKPKGFFSIIILYNEPSISYASREICSFGVEVDDSDHHHHVHEGDFLHFPNEIRYWKRIQKGTHATTTISFSSCQQEAWITFSSVAFLSIVSFIVVIFFGWLIRRIQKVYRKQDTTELKFFELEKSIQEYQEESTKETTLIRYSLKKSVWSKLWNRLFAVDDDSDTTEAKED